MSILKLFKDTPEPPKVKNLDRAFSSMTPVAAQPLPEESKLADGDDSCETWNPCTISGEGSYNQSGILLEVSPEEARVRFVSHTSLPETFEISVPRLGTRRHAELIKQDGNDAYVRFIRPIEEPCEILNA